MTITQLQYFLEVCRCGSVSRAADRQHVSQPAISNAIKSLEDECESLLFLRDNRSLTLTGRGEELLDQTKALLRHYQRVSEMLLDFKDQQTTLRIGVTPMGGSYFFPYLLYAFKGKRPGVTVEVFERNNRNLFKQVESGFLHLAFSSAGLPEDADFARLEVRRDRLVVAVHKNHPLAAKGRLTPEDLATVPMVLFPEGHHQYEEYHRMMRENGLAPNVLLYTEHVNTIYNFISAGVAAGYMFETAAAEFPNIRFFPMEGLMRPVVNLIWSKSHYMPSAARAFIDVCKAGMPPQA